MPVTLPAGQIPVQLMIFSFGFERALQPNEFLVKELNLVRTGFQASVVWAHLRADRGPNGGVGRIRLQDHPVSPVSSVDLVVTDTGATEADQEFDSGGFAGATVIPSLNFT